MNVDEEKKNIAEISFSLSFLDPQSFFYCNFLNDSLAFYNFFSPVSSLQFSSYLSYYENRYISLYSFYNLYLFDISRSKIDCCISLRSIYPSLPKDSIFCCSSFLNGSGDLVLMFKHPSIKKFEVLIITPQSNQLQKFEFDFNLILSLNSQVALEMHFDRKNEKEENTFLLISSQYLSNIFKISLFKLKFDKEQQSLIKLSENKLESENLMRVRELKGDLVWFERYETNEEKSILKYDLIEKKESLVVEKKGYNSYFEEMEKINN